MNGIFGAAYDTRAIVPILPVSNRAVAQCYTHYFRFSVLNICSLKIQAPLHLKASRWLRAQLQFCNNEFAALCKTTSISVAEASEAENRKLSTASQKVKSEMTGPWPQAGFAAEAEVDTKSMRKHDSFSLDNSPMLYSPALTPS